MQSVEDKIQVALHNWFKLQYPQHADCFYHSPNGGKRHPAVAKKLKAAGTKRGFPDICIFLPNYEFCFLAIELKTFGNETRTAKKGRPTKEQLEWIEKLTRCGGAALVCWGLDAAKKTIQAYMQSVIEFEIHFEINKNP